MLKSVLSLGLCLTLAGSLTGCNGEPSSEAAVVSPQNVATGTLLLHVPDSGLPAVKTLEASVLDADGTLLVEPVTVTVSGGGQELTVTGVPQQLVRVLLRALDEDGTPLASRELEVTLTGPLGEVTFEALNQLGQTREIGLVSVGANGTQASGPSTAPSLSADGRFVAFASKANLAPGGNAGKQAIFLRDRVLGTLTRISIRPDSADPIGTDCFEPDISQDGNRVAFRRNDLDGQGDILVRVRSLPLNLGIGPVLGTHTFDTGLKGAHPRISADGRFVVFDSLLNGLRVVMLRQVDSDFGEIISRAAEIGNQDSDKPCISGDGRFVVFHSKATNLGGAPGIFLRDRQTFTTTRLNIPANLEDTSISRDGRFVLASAPNQQPFLLDRQGSGAAVPIGAGLLGRPAMSDGGRFITFYSTNTALIDNDGNQNPDVFVRDGQNGLISRINVSSDFTSVFGGVDQTTALSSPAISADGRRIAFSSADRSLVPNTANAQLDVYSANVPSTGKIYLISGNTIQRYDDVSLANGPVTPAATISGGATKLFDPFRCCLDVPRDRLYVAQETGLLVFRNVSTKSGNVAPDQVVTGNDVNNIRDMAIDSGRDILYFTEGSEVHALANASLANGPATNLRTFTFTNFDEDAVLLDTRRDEIYVAGFDPNNNGREVDVGKASTATGNPPLKRRLFGAATQLAQFPTLFFGFDTSPRALQDASSNEAALVLLDSLNRQSTRLVNGSHFGFFPGTAPDFVIPSTSVPLIVGLPPKQNVINPGIGYNFDPNANLRYVGDRVQHSVQIYRSNPAFLAPVRTLFFTALPGSTDWPRAFALDRTR